jgi:hypothetical protein
MTLVRTLSALLAKYSWNRIALIYSIDDDGKAGSFIFSLVADTTEGAAKIMSSGIRVLFTT